MSAPLEVGLAFLRLGVVAFGGPVAHLGYFRREFVERRRWLGDEAYADFVALCQFLPGPSSSQVAFAIGHARAGVRGGMAASIGFLLPSAVVMIALAYGFAWAGDLRGAGWVHGLLLTTVAVVAQAVWAMARTLWTDWRRRVMGLVAAAVVVAVPRSWISIVVLAAGGVIGWWLLRSRGPDRAAPRVPSASHRGAAAALAIALVLLAALPLVRPWTGSRSPLAIFDSFYRAGALVFGGGHVVLPLLRAAVVSPGWVSDDAFLAGYGAAQALPGPLFSCAGYLGAVIVGGPHAWAGGVWALLAIFLPGWLLVGGALPYWHALRSTSWAPAALAGANAAVVGVLLAALYTPIMTSAIASPADAVAAIAAFALLVMWHVPPWVVVVAMAALGQWILA